MFTEDDLKIVYKNGVADGIYVVQKVNLANNLFGEAEADETFICMMEHVQERYDNLSEAIAEYRKNCDEDGNDPIAPMFDGENARV